MQEPDKIELGKRVRAARTYAGYFDRVDFAHELEANGYSGYREGVLKNLEAGKYEIPKSEHWLLPIARTCGVPLGFLKDDLWNAFSLRTGEEKVQAPPGLLGQSAQGSRPTPRRRGRKQPPKAADQTRGAD